MANPVIDGLNNDALDRYVTRIESLHVDRDAISGDIKEAYAEAKSAGFVTGIIRQIVRERRMEDDERHDQYALLDSYRAALGMLADTPLGQAAMTEAENTARRGRRNAGEAIEAARSHLDGEPAGSA
jgi:uncharacterized protein (UPF0335 family)